ncbi:hypothetical protein BC940DRAFT_236594 [Gongronella butleri]|nr:hypothetical protein BC940DRAFT_236594 [Gongronella butleri]
MPHIILPGNGTVLLPFPASSHQVSEAQSRLIFAKLAYCSAVINDNLWNNTMCKSALPDGELHATFDSETYDTTGYVVSSASKKVIYISFRGSSHAKEEEKSQLIDALCDNMSDLMPYPAVPGAKVHTGFYESYAEVQSIVVPTVASILANHPDYTVELTGHSLGAAQSLAATLDLYQRIEILGRHNLILYNYGQPRLGDKAFAAYAANTGLTHNRVVHHADVVPNLPPIAMGYLHSGLEYWIKNENGSYTNLCPASFENPHCSDSLAALGNIEDHLK